MLKLDVGLVFGFRDGQPPSGGCVLKPKYYPAPHKLAIQPPSGGCVLKQFIIVHVPFTIMFSRLRAAVC